MVYVGYCAKSVQQQIRKHSAQFCLLYSDNGEIRLSALGFPYTNTC